MKQEIINLWKDKEMRYMFIYILSVRRHFIPLLSIFFLTLPDTNLNQLGIFTAIGYIGWILFELPSGYISDTIGHKKTLLISRWGMIIWLLLLVLWWSIFKEHSFWFFSWAAIFMNVGFAFNSWTLPAFFYEILEMRWEQDTFTKAFTRMKWTVSLIAVFFLVLLPLTTQIHMLFPFILNIGFDIIGVIALLKLPNPRDSKKVVQGESEGILQIIKWFSQLWFIPFAAFVWLIGWIMHWKHAFDTVYLESIGLPIMFIGTLMWLSRFLWFILSRRIHLLTEYCSMKQILFYEILLYSGWLLIITLTQNIFITLIIFALMTASKQCLHTIHTQYKFEKYLKNPKYKATISSFSAQIENIIAVWLTFLLWVLIGAYWFSISYLFLSILMFITLSVSYYFIFKKPSHEKTNI